LNDGFSPLLSLFRGEKGSGDERGFCFIASYAVLRFYIYDNESQVSLRETLKEYIELGWVVVDISGQGGRSYMPMTTACGSLEDCQPWFT